MKRAAVAKSLSTFFLTAAVLIFSAGTSFGADDDRGPILSLGLSGSTNDPGWIYKLDTQAGYKFSRYFEADIGLPVYFVRVPDSAAVDGLSSKNGIGNAYFDLRFMLDRSDVYFSSTVRGTAPTGDAEEGFSTGRATFDWTNYIERSFGSLTPFGSIGIANTISDTHFFTRPFSSLGVVGHFEGGLYYQPLSRLGLAGSAYAIAPSGEQKIYSKIITRGSGAEGSQGSVSGAGNGQRGAQNGSDSSGFGRSQNRIFEEVRVVEGTEEIAKDHGFSGWIDVLPAPNVAFELGYSRSVSYDYNSFFFSVRFDLSRMIRRNR